MKSFGFSSPCFSHRLCPPRNPSPRWAKFRDFQLTSQSGDTVTRRQARRQTLGRQLHVSPRAPAPARTWVTRCRQLAARDTGRAPGLPHGRSAPMTLPRAPFRVRQALPGRPPPLFFLTGDETTLNMLDLRAFKLGKVDGSDEHSTRSSGRWPGAHPRLLHHRRRRSPVERICEGSEAGCEQPGHPERAPERHRRGAADHRSCCPPGPQTRRIGTS